MDNTTTVSPEEVEVSTSLIILDTSDDSDNGNGKNSTTSYIDGLFLTLSVCSSI